MPSISSSGAIHPQQELSSLITLIKESYFTYGENEESLIDHDVHWRPGLASDGAETFLPRTVIYDLKGGFGSLRKINALYEPTDEVSAASASSLW